jgi:glycosyltransferase involved in cell wall biosynthesis
MKIVYINSFYAPHEVGGAEKSVRFLAETMVKQGHEACVITLGPQRETVELNGVRIERLPIANVYDPLVPGPKPAWQKLMWHGLDSLNPIAGKAVAKILDAWRPEVAHTNNVSGFSVAVWRELAKRRIPIVHTLRDYYLLCPNTAMFKDGRPCQQRCTQCKVLSMPRILGTKLVRTVIGNSHFILNKHKAYGLFPNALADVIYNAYAHAAQTPVEAGTKGCLRLGYIGRIAATKGIETLIDAVKLATRNGVQLQALVAGDGDEAYVAELKQRAAGLPVQFLGRVKPEDFYTRIDWTVVPSLWDEPLARVIFESFCHGVPVMGSTTGGTPELVSEGRTGYLFPPGDASKLADIIKQASGDTKLQAHWQDACLEGAHVFAPAYVCERYLRVYQQAAQPGQP